MNKLLVALITSAFAFASASALAQAPAATPPAKQPVPTRAIPSEGDVMPLSKMDTDQAKAARAAAKAKWDKMTPEEKAAYKKAASQKKREELTAMEAVAADQGPVFDAKKAKEEAAASKAQPLPTPKQRQQDVTTQSKGSTGQ
jgi:acyl-CoA reductase-like NAD-dependent aldehyde dehydrogenase